MRSRAPSWMRRSSGRLRGSSPPSSPRSARTGLRSRLREGRIASPGFTPKIVDTTGAGDCFAAACLHARLAARLDWNDALRFANCAAAISTTGLGAQSALPTADQVAAHLSGECRTGTLIAARGTKLTSPFRAIPTACSEINESLSTAAPAPKAQRTGPRTCAPSKRRDASESILQREASLALRRRVPTLAPRGQLRVSVVLNAEPVAASPRQALSGIVGISEKQYPVSSRLGKTLSIFLDERPGLSRRIRRSRMRQTISSEPNPASPSVGARRGKRFPPPRPLRRARPAALAGLR